MPNTIIPRITPAVFLLAAPLTTFLWRLIYAGLFTSDLLRRRAIIVGYAGRVFVQDIRQGAADFDIVGFIDDEPTKQRQIIEELPVLGTRADLVRLVQQMKVSEVVQAITHGIHNELFQALVDCNEHCVDIRPMPATIYLNYFELKKTGETYFQSESHLAAYSQKGNS